MATIGYKIGRFQFQGGTKAELEASELILLENELALEVDEETGSVKMRRGDGKSKYADCPYIDIGMLAVDELTEEQIKLITGPRGEPGKDGAPGQPGKDGSDASIEAGKGLKKTENELSIDFKALETMVALLGFAKKTYVPKLVTLTQDEYDKLSPPDPNTYYFITE